MAKINMINALTVKLFFKFYFYTLHGTKFLKNRPTQLHNVIY